MRDKIRRMFRRLSIVALLTAVTTQWAYAGPPFFTDDPVPVDDRHNEFYLFSTLDAGKSSDTIQGPAIEYNRGVAANTQFHVVAPFTDVSPDHGPDAFGLGDLEVGVKYRFLKETDERPQAGIFPMVEFASGDASRGLGNGRTWYRLPLWIQKSWGPWTCDGGGGIDINPAPGMRNAWFGGLLVQRELSPHLTLGGEVFRQNAQADGGQDYTLLNFGGYYNVSPNFSLLFSAGRNVSGEQHTVAYLGLYWTWASPD